MSIQYDCYFCKTERDMGAVWEVCDFNRENDKCYWMKKPPCEKLDYCPFYIPDTEAYNLIKNFVKERKEEC